jgi:hypothetical protein
MDWPRISLWNIKVKNRCSLPISLIELGMHLKKSRNRQNPIRSLYRRPSILMIAITSMNLILISCNSTKHTASAAHNELETVSASETRKLQQKYASLLGVSPNEILNLRLYRFADDWMSTPYKYGGKSKSGVDCSGFCEILQKEVYNRTICCSSAEIFSQCKSIKSTDLQEGDFVFFKINSESVSHMGVYLENNKFIHASTQAGVIINDLNDPYYTKYFYKAGRLN